MTRIGALALTLILLASASACEKAGSGARNTTPPGGGQARPGGPGGPGGAPGGRPFGRPPMTVELVTPKRDAIAEQLTVVGNLVGDATVAVVPKTAGRLDAVFVRLGDRVAKGQRIGKIEDREVLEQVKQAEASFEVGNATVRQREADLKFAQTNLDRSKSLFERQLLPRQSLDDAEARNQAAVAQLDLARAQVMQNKARLEELRVILENTVIVSPVDGFVARRAADPGAYASPNAPIVDVVDINRVRLIANVVEKDLRRVREGQGADVGVDAFPGESFKGRIARVAPVLDPATRTATLEVEIPNPGYRLKPGMYARVHITTATRADALVVPRNAVVDLEGKRGVFVAVNQVASFRPIEVGIETTDLLEIASGVSEQDKVITTGAAALRDGDRILLAGARPGGPGGRGPNGAGGRGPGTAPAGPPAGGQSPDAARRSPGA